MPDFRFSKPEALALTLFLTGQVSDMKKSGQSPNEELLERHYRTLGQARIAQLEKIFERSKEGEEIQ